MTSSLTASIFGSTPDTVDDGIISNELFQTSATLPPKPNHLNFIESKTEREKRERQEEKKRKRKKSKVLVSEEGGIEQVKESEKDETANGDDDIRNPEVDVQEDEDLDRTIFVGNLPLEIKNTTLASMFKSCGKVKSARIRSVGTAGVKVAPEHAGNQVCLWFLLCVYFVTGFQHDCHIF